MTKTNYGPAVIANPYAHAFAAYLAAGWTSPLTLTYGAKAAPPVGYTGRAAVLPSYADCHAWADGTEGPQNIALWTQPGIIGIDVDAYDGKPGGETLRSLIAQLGPLPPTYLSTSRGDGMSGIRAYRVPLGVEFVQGLNGIDIIQPSHRYMVVWPSVHPNGATYQWIDERSVEVLDGVPHVDEVPDLPDAWVDYLTRRGEAAAKVDASTEELRAAMAAMPGGAPCKCVERFADKYWTQTEEGRSHHDAAKDATLALLGAGRRGCPGALGAVQALAPHFAAGISSRASQYEAAAEYQRLIDGALRIVIADPQGDGCEAERIAAREATIDNYMAELLNGPAQAPEVDEPQPEPTPEAAPVHEQTPEEIAAAVEDDALTIEARRIAFDLMARERARDLVAAAKATGKVAPQIVPMPVFMAAEDVDAAYRIDELWPAGGRVLVVAQAKTGKTTLVVSNLLPALLGWTVDGNHGPENCGPLFLGRYKTQPVVGRVVYINVEVGETTLRRWLRKAGLPIDERLQILNLRGAASSLNIGSEAGRRAWSARLKALGAEVVILDPVAPLLAALGLDENSNTDVATFWSWWGETLADAGVVDDVVIHHAGHAGERSRGASRLLDEPDAIWTITKDRDEQGDRYLEAVGRDVDLSRHVLDFDPNDGGLTIGEAKTSKQSDQSRTAWRERLLEIIGREGFIYRSAAAKLGGNSREPERQGWIDEDIARGLIDETEGGKKGTYMLIRARVPDASHASHGWDVTTRPSVPPSIDGDATQRGMRGTNDAS